METETKTETKNLTRSPALVFFLIMGIRSVYSLSVILPYMESGWDIFNSILTGLTPFLIAAALFFRIPNLLYLPFGAEAAAEVCRLIVFFAKLFSVGTASAADLLLLLLYFIRFALLGTLLRMTARFGRMKPLRFLPLILYLVYSIAYRVYITLIAGGGAFNLSLIFDLILTVPAYGFLGHWLASPYKKSYLRKLNSDTSESEKEENTNA